MSSEFQKVAYMGLRNEDGSYSATVPLYVKVGEVNQNGVTAEQENLIHRITEIMLGRYKTQLAEFMKKKKEKENFDE